MDVARRSAVDIVLNDSRVQHGCSYEAEADGDAHDRLQVDLPAVEQRINMAACYAPTGINQRATPKSTPR